MLAALGDCSGRFVAGYFFVFTNIDRTAVEWRLGQLHFDGELVATGWWNKARGLDLGCVGRSHPGLDTVKGTVVGLGPRNESKARTDFGSTHFGNGDLFLLVAEPKVSARLLKCVMNAIY